MKGYGDGKLLRIQDMVIPCKKYFAT